MIPKQHRGISSHEVAHILRNGRRKYFPNGRIVFCNGVKARTRLVIVIPKRIVKGAVMRAKIRRILHDAARPLFPAINPPLDIAILWDHGKHAPKKQEIEREIAGALRHREERHI